MQSREEMFFYLRDQAKAVLQFVMHANVTEVVISCFERSILLCHAVISLIS